MPLAVALLNVSNPEMGPMDMLSRLSHDSDEAVAQNAILALGVSSQPQPRLSTLRKLSRFRIRRPTHMQCIITIVPLDGGR